MIASIFRLRRIPSMRVRGAVVLLAILTGACGQARDPVLGRWLSPDEKGFSMELLSDGTALLTVDGSIASTAWRKLDDRRLTITGGSGRMAIACVSEDAMHLWFGNDSGNWLVRQSPDGTPGPMPDAAARQACANAS